MFHRHSSNIPISFETFLVQPRTQCTLDWWSWWLEILIISKELTIIMNFSYTSFNALCSYGMSHQRMYFSRAPRQRGIWWHLVFTIKVSWNRFSNQQKSIWSWKIACCMKFISEKKFWITKFNFQKSNLINMSKRPMHIGICDLLFTNPIH